MQKYFENELITVTLSDSRAAVSVAVRGKQRLGRQCMARSRRGLNQHRLAAEGGEDVPIRRIARDGDGDAVARLEQRQERENEAAGRAGGHDHPPGIERQTIAVGIVSCDARPQRRNAERLGVLQPACRERGGCGGQRRPRRWRGRLSHLHMDDVAAGRLDARGLRHHVHDDERRHVAAGGRQQQPIRAIRYASVHRTPLKCIPAKWKPLRRGIARQPRRMRSSYCRIRRLP
jgi:hypothetical protein